MGKMENSGIWEQIQKSVQETERLMGQKKYTLSMIKARQTMEFMVKLQCDKAGIVESTPENMIRELYEGKWISKSTAEHYMQILDLGNKATKEGDNSAYNATQAHHVLTQEIYAFVDADKVKPRRSSASRQTAQPSGNSTRKRQTATSAAASASSSARTSRSAGNSKKSKRSSGFTQEDLLKLLIPIALVIVLIFLIKVLSPEKDPTNETTPAAQISVENQQPDAVETTPAETETASAVTVTYKTTTTLNVRSGPSTDSERIGKFDPDKTVEYVRDHDDFWAVIMYNGQEAYVAKEYLTPVTE